MTKKTLMFGYNSFVNCHVCAPEEYLRSFDIVMGGQESAAMKSTGVPCKEYLSLVSWERFSAQLNLFDDCKHKADVMAAQQTLKDLKKPFGSLLGSVNAAKNELSRASLSFMKEFKLKQTCDKTEIGEKASVSSSHCRKEPEKKGAKEVHQLTMMEFAVEHAKEILICRRTDMASAAGKLEPLIFTKDAVEKELGIMLPEVESQIDSLERDAMASATDVGRATRKLPEETHSHCLRWLHACVPDAQPDLVTLGRVQNEQLREQLKPQTFVASASASVFCQVGVPKIPENLSNSICNDDALNVCDDPTRASE
eukprot:2230620-Amphidinium_carterae.4